MIELYTIILAEHANNEGQFVRDFQFYKGDLLFHFLHFNHCEDIRFCEIEGKRRQAIYCGMQWIDDNDFPVKYPFKLISGALLIKGPTSVIKAGTKKAFSLIGEPNRLEKKKVAIDPYYAKKKVKQAMPVQPLRPIRTMVYERDNFTCVCCGQKDFSLLSLDHIIPKSKGGGFTMENLQTMCKDCNNAKGNLTISVETLRTLIKI